MIRLQHCADCGTAQYPPREFCGTCLSDRISWQQAEALPGRLLARTVLHHSNEAGFRGRLPLQVALVRLDAGPVAVCFLAATASRDEAVRVAENADGLLEAF